MGGPNKCGSRWLGSGVGVDCDESGKTEAARATTTRPTPTKRAMPVDENLTVFALDDFTPMTRAICHAICQVTRGSQRQNIRDGPYRVAANRALEQIPSAIHSPNVPSAAPVRRTGSSGVDFHVKASAQPRMSILHEVSGQRRDKLAGSGCFRQQGLHAIDLSECRRRLGRS